jgi:hypothetical protein
MLHPQVHFIAWKPTPLPSTLAWPMGTNTNTVLSTRVRHSWRKVHTAWVQTRDLPADVEFAGSQLRRGLYSLSARATHVPRVRVSSSDCILVSAHLWLQFIFSMSLKTAMAPYKILSWTAINNILDINRIMCMCGFCTVWMCEAYVIMWVWIW